MTNEIDRLHNNITRLRKADSKRARTPTNSSPMPVFYAYQTVTQTVGSSNTVNLDMVVLDAEGSRTPTAIDDTLSPMLDRVYCRSSGLYEVSGGVAFAPQGSFQRVVWLRKNGTQLPASATRQPIPTSVFSATVPLRVTVVALELGDYVELMAATTSGTVSTAASGADHSSLLVRKIGNGADAE